MTQGGTGTATQFTAGSIVFAGASGIYAQDNGTLRFDDAHDILQVNSGSGVDYSNFGAGPYPLLLVSSLGTLATASSGVCVWTQQASATNSASTRGLYVLNISNLSGTGTENVGVEISVGNAVTNTALKITNGAVMLSQLTASRPVWTDSLKNLVSAPYALPSSVAANQLLYGTSSTQVSALSTANSSLLGTDASGNLGWITNLPAAITKGGKAVAIGYSQNLATSATSYTVTHNLGTRKLVVQLRDTTSGKLAHTAFTVTDDNTLTVAFRVAPSAGKFDVNIFAIL